MTRLINRMLSLSCSSSPSSWEKKKTKNRWAIFLARRVSPSPSSVGAASLSASVTPRGGWCDLTDNGGRSASHRRYTELKSTAETGLGRVEWRKPAWVTVHHFFFLFQLFLAKSEQITTCLSLLRPIVQRGGVLREMLCCLTRNCRCWSGINIFRKWKKDVWKTSFASRQSLQSSCLIRV